MDSHRLRSISQNLTISLVVVIVILTMAFLSIYYYQISSREKTRVKRTADEYISSIAKSLEVPLWDIDRENIDTVCSYYFKNDLIVMVKLIGESGEIFYNKNSEQKFYTEALLKRTKEIYRNGERLGKVMIALNPARFQKASHELLKISMAALLIAVVGLVFSTGVLLKKILKEPMNYLSQIARSYASGNYHPQIKAKSYREFEPLVSALVEMGETIESQMNELQRAEKSLKQHRNRLEEMVIQRTRELEISNQELQNEIRDRKRAQKKLKSNEQRLEAILTASPVGIGLLINRHLGWANETMYQMVGYEEDEILGRNSRIFYRNQKEYARVGKALYSGFAPSYTANVETQWLRKDGTLFDCNIRACSLDDSDPSKGQIIAVSDISEAKYLETKLQRAKKMEAIGTLAGGVAHDLNNILSGITSYPEILLMDIPDESPLRKPLSTIQKSGEKAAEIVQDLLTMARRGVSVTEVVNLNCIIAEQLNSPEMTKLKHFHPDVEVTPTLEAGLLNVKGSSIHLSKSIMNLISNAAEAMPGGGKIAISSRNRYLDAPLKGYEHIEEGEYVEISVSDTGMGMARHDIDHIFEPFYTKKKMGRSGTGLGMSVVWGTVKDHRGYIDINSSEGKGTTFTLFFPATRKSLKSDSNRVPVDEYKGSGQSILVIDDIEEQREIAATILEKLNYAVVSVSSGEEAIEYMKNNSADLLVIDMIMDPGMDGLDTYKKIIELHPSQKAIVASGFSRTDRIRRLQRMGAGQYIKKPYTLAKIGLAVKDELGRNRDASTFSTH
jgi:two-component system, cell cycle sensor histidine kinase and response regulator CckA